MRRRYSRLAFSGMTDIFPVCGEGSQGTGLPVNSMAITQDFVVRGGEKKGNHSGRKET